MARILLEIAAWSVPIIGGLLVVYFLIGVFCTCIRSSQISRDEEEGSRWR